jgi:hypothetical protein
MADLRAHLSSLAEALPAGTFVPVPREWLLELLGARRALRRPRRLPRPTSRCMISRNASDASRRRSGWWLEARRFPNAYRFQGREWRVPPSDLAAFGAQERERARAPPAAAPDSPIVAAWRKVTA